MINDIDDNDEPGTKQFKLIRKEVKEIEDITCPSTPEVADCLNCCWARICCWGVCIIFCLCCCCCACCWGEGVFIMLVPDLGELAYGRGGVDALSKEAGPAEGDGTDLPINCCPVFCS